MNQATKGATHSLKAAVAPGITILRRAECAPGMVGRDGNAGKCQCSGVGICPFVTGKWAGEFEPQR